MVKISDDQQTLAVNGVYYHSIPARRPYSCQGCALLDDRTHQCQMGSHAHFRSGFWCASDVRADHQDVIWKRATAPRLLVRCSAAQPSCGACWHARAHAHMGPDSACGLSKCVTGDRRQRFCQVPP